MQSHKLSELKISCVNNSFALAKTQTDCRSDLEQEHKHFHTYLPLSEDSFYIFHT